MRSLKFIIHLLKHKYYVFKYGLRTKAPLWRLIIHDWTKFLPSEFRGFRHKYHNGDQQVVDIEQYKKPFTLHCNRNPHHPEYWTYKSKNLSEVHPLDMPEWAVREMLADWMGACKGYTGKNPEPTNPEWIRKRLGWFNLTGNTLNILNKIVKEMK